MQANTRKRSNRSRSRRTYLDPHYFVGSIQRLAQGLGNSRKARASWVSYRITIAEVLEDLTYGQD